MAFRKIFAQLIFLNLVALSAQAYNIARESVTVSGISSGAYMAGQLHIAYSSIFSGAAIIAGGPYNCAEGSATRALRLCMKTEKGALNTKEMAESIRSYYKLSNIDSPENLYNDRVFLLSGTKDRTVHPEIVDLARQLYLDLNILPKNIQWVNDLPSGHALPTMNYGNACSVASESPFISNCNYDTSGQLLSHFYGRLNSREPTLVDSYKEISQLEFSPWPGFFSNSLADKAFLYVPLACSSGALCKLHVALHGCRQSTEHIGNQFYTKAGYNEWAESNNIIVLYPQVKPDLTVGNPYGCWDWWGYSSPLYHLRGAPQMMTIIKMIEYISRPQTQL